MQLRDWELLQASADGSAASRELAANSIRVLTRTREFAKEVAEHVFEHAIQTDVKNRTLSLPSFECELQLSRCLAGRSKMEVPLDVSSTAANSICLLALPAAVGYARLLTDPLMYVIRAAINNGTTAVWNWYKLQPEVDSRPTDKIASEAHKTFVKAVLDTFG